MQKNPTKLTKAPKSSAFNVIRGRLRQALMTVTGLPILVRHTGRIYRDATRALVRGEMTDFSGLPGRFAAEAAAHVEKALDLKVQVHGDFPKLQEGERGIILSNHPSATALFPWLNVVAQNFSADLRAVGKQQMLYDPRMLPPVLGWPAFLGGMMIPIDRRNPALAASLIRSGCHLILKDGDALMIFPDGHRPTQKKIHDSHAKMDERGIHSIDSMSYTCFPKAGGLMMILEATQNQPVRILNTTVGASAPLGSAHVFGATIHVHGQEVKREEIFGEERLPEPENDFDARLDALKIWLVEEWRRKNKRMEGWVEG